ncbi:MAG: tetratricopeptide repeat protein [Tannerella sp.]|nr:tetratricopeptide repeat protein [Tannerella sp.]
MKKSLYYILLLVIGGLLPVACNTKKNTATNRRYHAFTARYNTYFNGKTSFDESLASMMNGYRENYTERIYMFPVSAQPKDKKETGGSFDRAIEKGYKAVKQHSIQKKPPRKAGWQNDPKQVALQGKEEYNPFLKHCWMLIAQGQFHNADFLQASATFSYIARHYATDKEVVAEARIWQARCYAEMNWLFEAGSALDHLNENGIPKANQAQYDRFYADYLIKSGRFEPAIPYLQKAVKSEKKKRQRTRMNYLLGQIHAELGQNDAAYRTFGKVAGANPPYELEFAARIRQTEVFPGANYQSVLKMLKRMAKNDKNKDYLDQVYYAIGNIHISRQDTAKAIENYELGIEKSTQNGLDKAICQIRLGDIYFTQKDYVNAQPCFSGALAGMNKEYKDYKRVSRLSAVLDELVVHVEAVHLQDSLQALAKLPEAERLAVIDKIIEDLKKQEEEDAKNAEKEKYLAEQEARGSGLSRPNMQGNAAMLPGASSGDNSFYFYNEQTVAQGKAQFQSKWGKRPLEDNWRRRNKVMNTLAIAGNEATDNEGAAQLDAEGNPVIAAEDSLQLAMDSLASDPKSREYYLQQIPFSEDDVEASDMIIADGLFNMGMLYKDKLEDMKLSVDAFEELERRFSDNKYRMDYYYQIYLMALRYKDTPLGEVYKSKLIGAFPESDYAVAIADPEYEYHMRMMGRVQDSLYEETYNRYLEGDTTTVRRNYREFGSTYPLSVLIPKFMFLEALTYVQAGDTEGFKAALTALIEKYPQADVTELANEMLKGVLRGRMLVQGNFTGMTWNLRFGLGADGMLSAADSARLFTNEPDTPHRMLLIYETGHVERNQLLYAVAAFNFAKFTVKAFDLSIEETGSLSIMTINGFSNLDEALEYGRMIFGPDGYATETGRAVSFFPFSDRNYDTLMHGKTLEEYMSFFVEQYGEKAPELIARWKIQLADNEKMAEAEDEAVEKAANLSPDEEESPADEDTGVSGKEHPAEETVVSPEETPAEAEEEEIVRQEEQEQEEQIAPEKTPEEEVAEEETVTPKKPAEITLEQLMERRKQTELDEQTHKDEEAKALEQKRKDAAELKKQQAKTRDQLRREKAKEANVRLKQKEKERKEKERENKRRQKEKEAQKKAAQKAKTSANRK